MPEAGSGVRIAAVSAKKYMLFFAISAKTPLTEFRSGGKIASSKGVR